jgi:ParB family transcriptional regulator, chromosome partitioning protein
MSPLDDALFLAAYAKAYETLHPETRRGAASVLAREGIQTELSSFCDVIAEKRSITARQVRKIVAAGRNITRQEAEHLRSATRKVTLKDIEDIGKIGDQDERAQVVLKLAGGNAKTAAAARRMLRAEAVGNVVMNDKDAKYNALINAWRRAGPDTKRRFLTEEAAEIGKFARELALAEVALDV